MQLITPRTRCVICKSTLPPADSTFSRVPIYMGVTKQPIDKDITADQKWSICTTCGCVQLSDLLDPTVLYASSHTPGTIGSTWAKHHQEFADFVIRANPHHVLEIGAGTTHLANLIKQKHSVDSYTIVDPNVTGNDIDGVSVLRQLVTPSFSMDRHVDTIIHSHTMEHFYDPIEQLKCLSNILTDTGTMLVSVPLIINSIRDGFTNGLNFEHTYMTTVLNLYELFSQAGLQICTMVPFSPYNVFISAIKKTKDINWIRLNETNINKRDFSRYYTNVLSDISIIQSEVQFESPVYLFGAHVFSQVILSNSSIVVTSILDNDISKQGHRLYGTPHMVQSPTVIASDARPTVILRAGQYFNEILTTLHAINPNVNIV